MEVSYSADYLDFEQSRYSYCCCSCAFQHEFCAYIDDNGEVDEDVLDTVAQNFATGVCPRVNKTRFYIVGIQL